MEETMDLRKAVESCGHSLTEIGTLVGLGKSAVSRIVSGDYADAPKRQTEILLRMRSVGWLDSSAMPVPVEGSDPVRFDPLRFIPTENVTMLDSLAGDLLDRSTTLNSSIGIVMGSAGYGKTTAVRHFCSTHPDSFYVMYVQGLTDRQFVRKICETMIGRSERAYDSNLKIIGEAASLFRKLVIIDEADRMPQGFFDMIRGINEESGLPFLLCGEDSLMTKMSRSPRLRSRIRKPQVVFQPISIIDVATFWHEAVGMNVSGDRPLCEALLRMAGKDFRTLVNDAQHIVRAMNASGISTLTKGVLDGIDK